MRSNFSILVSGASVSGLCVAYWLCRYGFRVTVVERAAGLRPGGQALDVRGAAALEVAERMGILATIRQQSTKLAGMSLVDTSGKETFRSTERTLTGGKFTSPDVEILRDHLCEVLYEAVPDEVEFVFDDSIVSLVQDETTVVVNFANASPRRFDLVIGADGLRSNVRRLVFGPDEQFIRYLGSYISVFSAPNFLGLNRWQIFCQDGEKGGGILALKESDPARIYLGFNSAEPLDYDYQDIDAQKRLLESRLNGLDWEFPRLLSYMHDSKDFYFDSINQVRMDRWSQGPIVLLGDAGYAVSLSTGQGTSVAMVAAYVLAGEIATYKHKPMEGLESYEHALRDYVRRNQELASNNSMPDAAPSDDLLDAGVIEPESVPDFGEQAVPYDFKSYAHLSERAEGLAMSKGVNQ